MVVCIIAAVVFGILGIFSAKYRAYAREAFRCVSRTVTFRPCDTEFNRKMKAKITASLMKRSEKLGSFVYRRFELLSWLFLVSMIASLLLAGLGGYNLAVYGNCNGPESTDICILNPEGASIVGSSAALKPELVTEDDDPSIGSGNITIVEFGCHLCPYTKKAEPVMKELLEKYEGKIRLVFRNFPVKRHRLSTEAAAASECAHEQWDALYWKYHDMMFEKQKELDSINAFKALAKAAGLDAARFNECIDSQKYLEEVDKDFIDGQAAGVYGTPTFFIGNTTIVGPKSLAEFEKAVNGQMIRNEEINACVD